MENKRSMLVIYHMKQILHIFGQAANLVDDERVLLLKINQHYQVDTDKERITTLNHHERTALPALLSPPENKLDWLLHFFSHLIRPPIFLIVIF